ncbi:MAG: hypothetical protein J6T67_10450 [Paludibacteraceae bacterium]|nr:hypothetical protein [Paludibacteraceae bacterium]
MTNDDKKIKEALDYEGLKNTALRYIQKIGHKHWTDFNIHDPGVTLLESICFSLSDLAYRTEFSVADLLTREGENHPDLGDSLYGAEQILSSNPINADEYRKLILEYIPSIRNVWVYETSRKCQLPSVYNLVFRKNLHRYNQVLNDHLEFNVQGYYDIRIERESDAFVRKNILGNDELCEKLGLCQEGETCSDRISRFDPKKYDEWLCSYVSRLLYQHRNLNETFLDVKILTPVDVKVRIDVETDSDDYENIISMMCERLSEYVSPKVKLHSLQQLIDKGRNQESIYCGYFGEENGFIRYGLVDMDELRSSRRRLMLQKSEVYRLLKECDDIKEVKDIRFYIGGKECGSSVGHVSLSDFYGLNDPDKCFRLIPFEFSRGGESSKESESKVDDKVSGYLLKTQNPFVERTLRSLSKGEIKAKSWGCSDPNGNRIFFVQKSRTFELYLTNPEEKEEGESLELGNPQVEIAYPLPQGRYRHTDRYYSFQNLLPEVYKMRSLGRSKSARERYNINRLQLKGYLTFFDQFLANYVKQLSCLNSYFSVRDVKDLEPTLLYYDLLKAWKTDDGSADDGESSKKNSSQKEEPGAIADIDDVLRESVTQNVNDFWRDRAWNYNYVLEHRNRLLDYLLAVYNESFEEIVPLVQMNCNDEFDGRKYLEESVKDKSHLLKEYVSLNQDRTIAIGRTGTLELSGVERRILTKLGVDSPKAKIGPLLDDESLADLDMDEEFEAKFGIHVLEHIMLLPKGGLDEDSFLEMTAIEDKLPVADPYSFYVTVLYPGELKIFSGDPKDAHGDDFNRDFRNYVRKVIRDELPAHIDAIIIGVTNEQMKEFEDAYEKYLDHLAHPERTPNWAFLQRMYIIQIRNLLLGLSDVHNDRNHAFFGIRHSRSDRWRSSRLPISSRLSWRGISLDKMLRSIERRDMKKHLPFHVVDKKKICDMLMKKLMDDLNDNDLMDIVWTALSDHDDMMKEFEQLLNDPDFRKKCWEARLDQLSQRIHDLLPSYVDVHPEDVAKNNVVWGIERPQLPRKPRRIIPMPSSKRELGRIVVGLLRSINMNRIKK